MKPRTRTITLILPTGSDPESPIIRKSFEVNDETGADLEVFAKQFFQEDQNGTRVMIPRHGSLIELFPIAPRWDLTFICNRSSGESDEFGDSVELSVFEPMLYESSVMRGDFSRENLVRFLGTLGWK